MARDPNIPHPPVNAYRHRRWRVWYDFGVLHNGSTVVETGWYALHPSGDIIMSSCWNAVIRGIDEVETSRGRDTDQPSPIIPGRADVPYRFWEPDLRGKA